MSFRMCAYPEASKHETFKTMSCDEFKIMWIVNNIYILLCRGKSQSQFLVLRSFLYLDLSGGSLLTFIISETECTK